jgi:cytochrome c-type biogenesis protein CcmE
MDIAQAPDRASVKIVASVSVLVLSVALATAPMPESSYHFVDEAVAHADALAHRPLRVHGFVQPGSIERFGRLYRFTLAREGAALATWSEGPLPDTFRDGSEVIVNGHLVRTATGWLLEGTTVIAKCVGKYEGSDARLDAVFR